MLLGLLRVVWAGSAAEVVITVVGGGSSSGVVVVDIIVVLGDTLIAVVSGLMVVIVGGSVGDGVVEVLEVVVVVVVGLIRHSPDLKSHSCSGHESHFNLQSLPYKDFEHFVSQFGPVHPSMHSIQTPDTESQLRLGQLHFWPQFTPKVPLSQAGKGEEREERVSVAKRIRLVKVRTPIYL